MHAHQHWFAQGIGLALDQCNVFGAIQFVAVSHCLKAAEAAGQLGLSHAADEALVLQPVAY